jgi:4'-phosphopantetheinyl transferase
MPLMPIDDPECQNARVFAWPAGPAALTATVWALRLDRAASGRDDALARLSDEERERASRIPGERDRSRFVAARAGLRVILGACLDVDARAIGFRYGPRGRPSLDGAFDPRLHFSVSHSGDVALVAVTRDGRIGVDIERHRPVPGLEPLLNRFFSPRERAALPDGDGPRTEAFFRHWTLKEAWLKATGEGLAGALEGIEVGWEPEGEPLLRRPTEAGELVTRRLQSWSPAPGFVAGLAVVVPGEIASNIGGGRTRPRRNPGTRTGGRPGSA